MTPRLRLGVAAAILLAAGCATSQPAGAHRVVVYEEPEPAFVEVPTPPPPPQEEVIPEPPGETVAWKHGRWAWRDGGWRWMPGRYVERPGPGAVWVPGHWAERRWGWTWVPGYWL
jgi:hypothetical protein